MGPVVALALSLALSACGLAPASTTASDETGRSAGADAGAATGRADETGRLQSWALAPDEATGPDPAAAAVSPNAPGADTAVTAATDTAPVASQTEPDPGTAPTPPAASTAEPQVTGTIVAHAVIDQVVARTTPAPDGPQIGAFAHPTERGGPLVFQALGTPVDGWIEVLLPIRPNGSTGWIQLDDVELTRNPYRIEVDVEAFQLSVFHEGEVTLVTEVALGLGDTPTPIGDFYLIELLQPPDPSGPYGTYAYGLSGYSEVLDSFNGGDGIVGIHGTNEPELLGGPASHGCIRVHNDFIEEMADFLPLGTPVSIAGQLPEL